MHLRAARVIAVVGLALCASLIAAGEAPAATSAEQCATTPSVDASGTYSQLCQQAIQIKHLPRQRLEAVVRRQAALLGEHHPAHAAVVISTRRAATTATGSIVNDDTPIYFVQARGHFTCGVSCFGAPGAKPPTGRYMTLGLSLDHLDIVDFGVSDQSINLRDLGSVHRLSTR